MNNVVHGSRIACSALLGDDSFDLAFDATGTTTASPGWQLETYGFTAGEDATLLGFDGENAGGFGLFLDDVNVTQVPLPATGVLFVSALALTAAGVTRRRTRAR